MDWRLVLGLSSLGLLVGILSLFGLWQPWAEFLVWLCVGAVWVTVLHFRVRDGFFWHGAATAAIGGLLGIMTQVAFIETYLANNPDVAQGLGGTSVQRARAIFAATGLVVAAIYGGVTGLALWLTFPGEARAAARRAKRKPE